MLDVCSSTNFYVFLLSEARENQPLESLSHARAEQTPPTVGTDKVTSEWTDLVIREERDSILIDC